MEENTKNLDSRANTGFPEMPKSEDEQRKQNEDYARSLGLEVIDPLKD